METFSFAIQGLFMAVVLSIGLWSYLKKVRVMVYEFLSVVVGAVFGALAFILAINFEEVFWLLLLVPSLLFIAFGWWRVFRRYKSSSDS